VAAALSEVGVDFFGRPARAGTTSIGVLVSEFELLATRLSRVAG
jgi:hypothetical protein